MATKYSSNFPDPLLPKEKKESKEYGLQYAKAIQSQWGNGTDYNSLFRKRRKVFDRNRDYANGTQDTTIYKQILTSLDPNNGDGSLVNLDFTPVPILSKFARIVVNKILSRDPYPNVEAVDPLSSSEKNKQKRRVNLQVQAKEQLKKLKETTGMVIDMDPDNMPDTLEEAEILFDTNIKTDAEVAAQIGANLTLEWSDFNDSTYRRCVNDLVSLGMAVTRRTNDPNYGINVEYVDPANFVHSYTEDPSFSDLIYGGHVRRVTISELKRLAGDELTEDDYKKIQKIATRGSGNKNSGPYSSTYDKLSEKYQMGYDEYMVEILDFEFISTDTTYYEEKENRFGNTNFFYKGDSYKERTNSIFSRKPHKMEMVNVYCGTYIMGTEYLFGYGLKSNMPRNIHDISKTNMSFSVVATNMRNMVPKSMVDSCVGFADMLQITHLKIQQSIAKAKPDGLIIDIEGLENVQLGKGGELQPLDLHDIYEQTGVFYYRSKNPEGGFQNPPVREIGNSIRNINELIGLYNHYLRMIRDATGINEVMDASTPKSEALVGVREQALAAANNAIYDITNSAAILYKKVCTDVVKCLQILPSDSVVTRLYENAIGKKNMEVLGSFTQLPMYNFGVTVQREMEDAEKAYLEQNIQISLSQKELDIEDAMAIRSMKDINQAERLLILRRKKRMMRNQEMAMQNSQAQAQAQMQATQAQAQAKAQEMQLNSQLTAQELQLKNQLEIQLEGVKHEFRKEIEIIKAKATLGFREEDKEFREKLEVLKEDGKDRRIDRQAEIQSEMIDKREGKEPENPIQDGE
jgi:hypothetical protein